jgi:hypothetical protein
MARSKEYLITRPDCVVAKRLRAIADFYEPPQFSAELDFPDHEREDQPAGSELGHRMAEPQQ